MADKNNKQKKQVEEPVKKRRTDQQGLLKRPAGMNKIMFRSISEYLKDKPKF